MNAVEDLAQIVTATRELCEQRLAWDDLRLISSALCARGMNPGACVTLLSTDADAAATISGVRQLKEEIAAEGLPVGGGEVERCLLIGAALHVLPELPRLPVSFRVQTMICDEFRFFASAESSEMAKSGVGTSRFVRMAKIATYRRYPAGQFEWEVSGIARRDLVRVDPQRLPATIAFVLWRMGGLAPVFFSHLNPRRGQRSLREDEANRSYYQMAKAMELQPEIRGFAACSWFRSPSTHRVSPRLEWLSRVFIENGGWVVDAGRESPDCGVFHSSATRRRLYETAQFTPRRGLVMWPRRAMLAWAAAHPEFANP